MRNTILISVVVTFLLYLNSCGPKGHRKGMHGDHHKKKEYKLLTKNDFQNLGEYTFDLNNGTEEQYESASNLSGTPGEIQEKTYGLWPRMAKGEVYEVSENKVQITENEKYMIFVTNNLPDHILTKTNPNRARSKSYNFYIQLIILLV